MNKSRRKFLKEAGKVGLVVLVSSLFSAAPIDKIPFSISSFMQEAYAGNGSYDGDVRKIKKKITRELLKLVKEGKKKKAYYECRQAVSELSGFISDSRNSGDISDIIKQCEKATPIPLSANTRKRFAKNYEKLREKYAKEFFKLGERYAKQRPSDPQKALKVLEQEKQCKKNALVLNPDDKKIRKAMNEEHIRGYGWVKSDFAKPYKSGKRQVDSKWISRKQAEKTHKDWKKPWVLKGMHFEIRTNTSEQEAINMLEQAEEIYQSIRQEFGKVLELKEPSKQIVINYYDKISDYAHNIPERFQSHSWIGRVGFYDGKQLHVRKEKDSDDVSDEFITMRNAFTAYFLDYLVKNTKTDTTTVPNFWAIEGFSAFAGPRPKTICPGIYEINQMSKPWLDYYKTIPDEKFKPLAELIKVYSPTSKVLAQSWGLTHYLWNAENGRYRYRFIKLLGKVCTGQAKEDDFEKILGIKPDESFNQSIIKHIKALR